MVQKIDAMIRIAMAGIAAAALLVSSGCAGREQRPEEDVSGETGALPQPSVRVAPNLPPAPLPPPPSPPARSSPPPRENRLSAATQALVTQARTQLARGDLDGASSTLDRALRIEPNNPLLWVERGKLRLLEGDARQAEGCGRKALALASGDRSTQAQAGRVIADALRKQGRNPEASELERQPYMR